MKKFLLLILLCSCASTKLKTDLFTTKTKTDLLIIENNHLNNRIKGLLLKTELLEQNLKDYQNMIKIWENSYYDLKENCNE